MGVTKGWVKLHRAVMDSWIWQDSSAAHLWMHLCMEATAVPRTKVFNKQIVTLKRGQLISSYRVLAKDLGMTLHKVNRYMGLLEQDKKIQTQKFAKFSLITIVNYEHYQENQTQTERKPNAGQTQQSELPFEYNELQSTKKEECKNIYKGTNAGASALTSIARCHKKSGCQACMCEHKLRKPFGELWIDFPKGNIGKIDTAFKRYQDAIKKTNGAIDDIRAGAKAYSGSTQNRKGYERRLSVWLDEEAYYSDYTPAQKGTDGSNARRAKANTSASVQRNAAWSEILNRPSAGDDVPE